MYVGRIVSLGMTPGGAVAVMYRVSSRSFPNREAKTAQGAISIMPRKGFEQDLSKNPYIAYNCLRLSGAYAIASNGSHTDPIAEKIASGMHPRDALAYSLLALDYEKDDFSTPRIAAVVKAGSSSGFLSVIRKDALHVVELQLSPGKAFYVATYEHDTPSENFSDAAFKASNASEACEHVISKGVFAGLEKPVTAAAAVAAGNSFETATANA
ncbi:MAG: IMP cyclohydrolase [Victivallales bacterium]|nr:IMP cyclohydrolase [Victivallales bacterium]